VQKASFRRSRWREIRVISRGTVLALNTKGKQQGKRVRAGKVGTPSGGGDWMLLLDRATGDVRPRGMVVLRLAGDWQAMADGRRQMADGRCVHGGGVRYM
jgi:hypothetical protein